MSRVGVSMPGPPKELQSEKSITFQTTNPQHFNGKLINNFLGVWPQIDELVKAKTGRYFRIYSIETPKGESEALTFNFKVYKDSPVDYETIADVFQEFLPEHGLRVLRCDRNFALAEGH